MAVVLSIAGCGKQLPGDISKSTDTSTSPVTSVVKLASTSGSYPYSGLVQGKDGNLYGTTFSGGAYNAGTVFKSVAGGAPITLFSFGANKQDGSAPYGGLALDDDGNFYGTTSESGASDKGTVFKITPDGVLTTLHAFGGAGDGATPSATLVRGSDGSFYGTTQAGGANGGGTVYKIAPGGGLSTLYSFGGVANDAAAPYSGLLLAKDGNFYGTTPLGGANGEGTVYRISPSGGFNILYSFSALSGDKNADGALPYGALTQGGDGNLYGVASYGGSNNLGTVFKITPAGTLSTLYSFSGADGAFPRAGLVDGGDGNLYGAASGGGSNNRGTAFKITPAGALAVLYSFGSTDSDGASPYGSLLKTSAGAIFGTALGSGVGAIYRVK